MSVLSDLSAAHGALLLFDRSLPDVARDDIERELSWRQGRLSVILHHELHLVMSEDDVRVEIDEALGALNAASGVASAYLYDTGGPMGRRWWDTDAAQYFGEYGRHEAVVL